MQSAFKVLELDTADEMGVGRGYVGVFIDSPGTKTHDPSSVRERMQRFPLLRCTSGSNSPHIFLHGWPGIPILTILFFGEVFLLKVSKTGYILSKTVTLTSKDVTSMSEGYQ